MRIFIVLIFFSNLVFSQEVESHLLQSPRNNSSSVKKSTIQPLSLPFFDDFSKDHSIDKIKDFKEVKIIQNIEKTKIGSFNQMKAFEETYKLSKGEIILLLDNCDDVY